MLSTVYTKLLVESMDAVVNKSQYQRIDAVYNKKQFIPIKHTYIAIGQDDYFSYKESPEYVSELINRIK